MTCDLQILRTFDDLDAHMRANEFFAYTVRCVAPRGATPEMYLRDDGHWYWVAGGSKVPSPMFEVMRELGAVFVTDADKPAACAECPRAKTSRHAFDVLLGEYSEGAPVDVLMLMSQPFLVRDRYTDVVTGIGLSGDQRSVLTTALGHVIARNPARRKSTVLSTYVAQCVPIERDEKPNAKVLAACEPRVKARLEQYAPRLIVACGTAAMKFLGLPQKFMDVRGRILEPAETGLEVPVLVTFSEAALAAAAGLFTTFVQDLHNAYSRLENPAAFRKASLEELTAKHRHPKTMDEALETVRFIREYAAKGMSPDDWWISIDTETTSLRPEREGTKIIAFCFGWDDQQAATILYDHPHAPPEYLARLPELEAEIRALLASPKPKTLHNAKFDLKWIELKYKMPVNNVLWCSLVGEHLLDEDKKGNYGLKALTAVWLPHFCGYEDKLYDLLMAEDAGKYSELDDTVSSLASEYGEFRDALLAYRAALEEYDLRLEEHRQLEEAYREAEEEYQRKLTAYKLAAAEHKARAKRPRKPSKPKQPRGVDVLDGMFEEYTKELQAYDAALAAWEAWEEPPAPVKDFTRPVRPAKLDKPPQAPEDPRSRKEREFMTDAGFERLPVHDLQVYGAVDGDVTRQLTRLQRQRLAGERQALEKKCAPRRPLTPPTANLMRTHGIPASRVLGRMEYDGTAIDQVYAADLQDKLTEIIDTAKAKVVQMAAGYEHKGTPFNIDSGAHIAGVVYHAGWRHPDGQWVSPVECLEFTTKTKQESTTEKALKPYIAYDETISPETGKKVKTVRPESLFLEQLFLYKKATKARDTFLVNLRVLSKLDGRIHTSFNITGTGTGRLSSSDMNLQNVPKKLAGLSLKKLFVPDNDDFVFVNADYKGAEVRVFTAYARDAKLIEALNNGLDMHSFFASLVFKRPYEDYQNRDNAAAIPDADYRLLLDKERSAIKRVVFGILYGAGEGKIAETIGIPRPEAADIIAKLFEMFPDIKRYIDEVNSTAVTDKYVETLFGRRRRFPLAGSSRHRSRAQRQACNFKIQSTSSDIVIGQLIEMQEMIDSDQTWPEWGIHKPLHTYGVRLLLTVHDSIALQWPKALIRALEPWLRYYGEERVREKYPWLPVPFAMDIECGPSYGECVAVSKYIAEMPAVEEAPEGLYSEDEQLRELREDAFLGDAA